MSRLSVLAAGAILLGFTAAPAFAHHQFSAEFDAKKPVTLSGTISKVNWSGPHAHLFVDVKDENGAVKNWDIELGSPTVLAKRGWSKAMLKADEQVTVEGWQAKDGSDRANAKSVSLNGRTLSAASSYRGAGRTTAATTGRK